MSSARKYWPFEVLAPEKQTKTHSQQVRFFENAFSEGFAPYADERETIGISSGEKGAIIIVRGRGMWEVLLGFVDRQVLSAFVNDFEAAGNASLSWLRGEDVEAIAEQLNEALSKTPKGMPNLSISK